MSIVYCFLTIVNEYSVLGLTKLGFLINFISGSVLRGFMNAQGFALPVSQLPALFGVKEKMKNLNIINSSMMPERSVKMMLQEVGCYKLLKILVYCI